MFPFNYHKTKQFLLEYTFQLLKLKMKTFYFSLLSNITRYKRYGNLNVTLFFFTDWFKIPNKIRKKGKEKENSTASNRGLGHFFLMSVKDL